MPPVSYARHRFPPAVIQPVVWLYRRFTLSLRDVEDVLADRGLASSYATVRRWARWPRLRRPSGRWKAGEGMKFGPAFARRLRATRCRPTGQWHLDDMVISSAGERLYLWRAVDEEGAVLDMLVQRHRDTRAAMRLMRKLPKKLGFAAAVLVTDKRRAYAAACRQRGLTARHEQGLRTTNRIETAHQPSRRRETTMQRFKSAGSAQRFLSSHAAVHNVFNTQRHLTSRRTLRTLRAEAIEAWQQATAAA